ncbi:MAG: hypothetical protein V4635_02200 [Bacteroidota bacterium]
MENRINKNDFNDDAFFEYYTMEQRLSILVEAMAGKKSLGVILAERNIPEEIFYSWKMKYLNLFI